MPWRHTRFTGNHHAICLSPWGQAHPIFRQLFSEDWHPPTRVVGPSGYWLLVWPNYAEFLPGELGPAARIAGSSCIICATIRLTKEHHVALFTAASLVSMELWIEPIIVKSVTVIQRLGQSPGLIALLRPGHRSLPCLDDCGCLRKSRLAGLSPLAINDNVFNPKKHNHVLWPF